MNNETLNLCAIWEISVFDELGNLKQKEVKKNLIVNNGYDLVLDCLFKSSDRPSVANYIAIGTGTVSPIASDTALEAEVGTRVAGTYTHTAGTKVATISGTFNPNNPTTAQPLTEAGLFNDITGGTMFNRVTFPVINKGTADTLTITVTLTLT